MVGSILYGTTISRPDISQAVTVLTHYNSKWNKHHVQAAHHLLRYIRGTLDYCLTFDAEAGRHIVLGYADANWGRCLDTHHSTTRYLFKAFGGPVAWRSHRQPTTALSTAEAEYMATSDVAWQALWLRQLLSDLGFTLDRPLTILNDNNAAILLSRDPVHHDKSKHIDIRHHHLREQVEKGNIEVQHISTTDNVTDMLTKSLPQTRSQQLRERLGVTQKEI